jgi:hypothetical protein
MHAQVTIGSESAPQPAALLQLQEYEAISGSGAETATKGIILPRVKLNSASDITVITNASPDELSDLTGLLVYNVNTTGMEEGIYEWDGQAWVQLEFQSKNNEKSETFKSITRTSNLNSQNVPVVNIGRFSFRFSQNKEAQCKLLAAPPGNESVGFHIARFWNTKSANTYAYDSKKLSFTPGNFSVWQNLYSKTMPNDERWEVWLADSVKNAIYKVQFIIYKQLKTPVYIILVTEL